MSDLMEYSFNSNEEPSDEQLHQLMKEVAEEVKANAIKCDQLFYEQLDMTVAQVLKESECKYNDKTI
jgi:S-adenosylmethionine/arginine decarboxylase-like enzyme